MHTWMQYVVIVVHGQCDMFCNKLEDLYEFVHVGRKGQILQ